MTSESQKKAVARYNKANTVQVGLRLNKKTEADIIAALDAASSKMGYIKQLIRDDIARKQPQPQTPAPKEQP